MSNTKQQIEEMISDFGEDAIRYGEELHTGRVKSDEEIKADSVELLQKQTEIFEAIDRLVTEACLQEFKTMWNKTQPDIVPEGWTPDTEEGEYIKDRIAELKSQLNEEQK